MQTTLTVMTRQMIAGLKQQRMLARSINELSLEFVVCTWPL